MGIQYLDSPNNKYHIGHGQYNRSMNFTGNQNVYNQTCLVRNCFFEPVSRRDIDWVSFTLKQIESAFRFNHPAIISSHRVNFSGNIDEKNRANGINDLRKLLIIITKKWPSVEFMSTNALGDLIANTK